MAKKYILPISYTLAAIFITISIAATIGAYILGSNPGTRFLLLQANIINPVRVIKEEFTINTEETKIPVYHYHSKIKSDRYYIFLHGLTPLGYKHPTINSFAAAFVDATGINVFIPDFTHYIKKNQNFKTIETGVSKIYLKLNKLYPGRYRGFGACIGGSVLLNAMSELPKDVLPEKIFLYGPYNNGKGLMPVLKAAADSANEKVDFIVRLTLSSRDENFSEQERDLIEKALTATKPGKTDTTRMKKILGSDLFNTISVINFNQSDLKDLDVEVSGLTDHFSDTKFFIIHSKTDRIIPFQEGKKSIKKHERERHGRFVSWYGNFFPY